jgi:hypothetical protein
MGKKMRFFNFHSSSTEDYHQYEKFQTGVDNCPIADQAAAALDASREALSALLLLRDGLIGCEACPEASNCELREDYHARVDHALSELYEEWGW